MKKILAILFLSVVLLIGSVYYNPQFLEIINEIYYQPCSSPILYKIGMVDEKYGITQQQFDKDIQEASLIWQKITNKKLFKSDQNSKLTINLVYDERQKLHTQISNIQDDLKQKQQQFKPTEEKYKVIVAQFEKDLSDLNKEVGEWNAKGGAPQEIYVQLMQRQAQLKTKSSEINQIATFLNKSAKEFNNEVVDLKDTAQQLGDVIQQKPEEGLYDPQNNKIDIFLNVNKNEFTHTLAHELGHALKLDHTSSAKSIMYPFSTSIVTPDQQDIDSINAVCNSTMTDRAKNMFQLIVENYQKRTL